MPNEIALLRDNLGGYSIKTWNFKGKQGWLSFEIGRLLGYSESGSRLTHKITNEWSDEFIAEEDYSLIDGENLAELKAILKGTGTTDSVGRLNKLYVLYESGLWLVLSLTHKPIGRQFRRLVASKILPSAITDPLPLTIILQAASDATRVDVSQAAEEAAEELEE